MAEYSKGKKIATTIDNQVRKRLQTVLGALLSKEQQDELKYQRYRSPLVQLLKIANPLKDPVSDTAIDEGFDAIFRNLFNQGGQAKDINLANFALLKSRPDLASGSVKSIQEDVKGYRGSITDKLGSNLFQTVTELGLNTELANKIKGKVARTIHNKSPEWLTEKLIKSKSWQKMIGLEGWDETLNLPLVVTPDPSLVPKVPSILDEILNPTTTNPLIGPPQAPQEPIDVTTIVRNIAEGKPPIL